jgi:hypothetical protein
MHYAGCHGHTVREVAVSSFALLSTIFTRLSRKRAIEAIVCEIAAHAGATDPQSLAQELCLIFEGAYVTRQVTGNSQTIEIARRVADRVISANVSQDVPPISE